MPITFPDDFIKVVKDEKDDQIPFKILTPNGEEIIGVTHIDIKTEVGKMPEAVIRIVVDLTKLK